MANLFVYGTLMDKSRLHELTGKSFLASPAVLKNFRKLDSGRNYPYIVPQKGAVVEGLLFKDMDEQSFKKLDKYEDEGRLFTREKVSVICEGKKISCEAYVGNQKLLRPET